ncbi:MAG: serine hydrolase [Halieaceae bacterium]|jgi:CubicO group peptidase (beta-lactamase class C family)|nr:serine hydrolase [Halieaceae bacterium]
MKNALTIAGLVLLGGLSLGFYKLSPVLSGGSGYAAKNICSGHFISGFSGQQIVDEALRGASPLLADVSFDIDEVKGQVDARFLGFFTRRAIYREHTGCTLLQAGQDSLDKDLRHAGDVPEPDPQAPWPSGAAPATASDGFDTILTEAFSEIDPQNMRSTKAVVIIHKGTLVAERYAEGVDAKTPLIGWSMTKSITSLLTGMRVLDGALSIHDPAPVPSWQEDAGDPRAKITLDQLLRMSSGLEFDETYAMFSDVQQMLSNEPDAGAFAASMPLFAEPDTHWAYSSGTTNIVSGIVRRSLGGSLQSYYDFTRNRLFNPLGMTTAILETDASGTFVSSSYSYVSARDWARLGQFCLLNGNWNGEQLLPENWITYSTTPTPTHPYNNYGAHFWLNEIPENAEQPGAWPSLPPDAYFMSGYQGQFVAMVPSEDLVVVRLGFTPGKNHGVEELVAGAIEILNR